MSSIVVSGDTSGAITIAAPAVSGTNTLTLPALTGTILTTASSGQVIPSAALPVGTVLQVVSTTNNTSYSTSSSSFQAATAIAVTITPKFSTSKIYLVVTGGNLDNGTANNECSTTVYRGGTDLGTGTNGLADYFGAARVIFPIVMSVLDSPATTSATTYTMYFKTRSSVTVTINNSGTPITITAMEIAA